MTTPSTTTAPASSWSDRSFSAFGIRALAFLIPVAASLAWTIVLSRILPEPSGFAGHFAWWVIIAGGAILVAMLVERMARRMLPMAMLLRLSLVFPEAAPSRFSMALRSNSARQLKRRVEDGVIDEAATPQEAAITLLELSAALSVHDRRTRGHAERVRAYSVMIGEQLELSPDDLNKLQWSALLHDIGKLEVSADILNKPGAPDEEEMKAIHAHPDRGSEYMDSLIPWLGEWGNAALQHHERFDGTGYPAGLSGQEISLSSRIVAVADAYDVMTSTRSYKAAMDPQVARTELLDCSGSQFDPEIVRAFLSIPVSELRRPFQAALGAGALASVAQVLDFRTVIAAGAAGVATVVAGVVMTAEELPPAMAFVEETPAVVEMLEDSPLEIPLRTTTDADSFSLDSVTGPATASITEDVLRIEPAAEQSGTVTVVLTACGGEDCDTTTITAEVVAVNDPPFANADAATTDAMQDSISIPVLANDTDVDSGGLSIERAEVVTGKGTVELSNGNTELLFSPQRGSFGPWTIEYVVTDGGDGFDRGTVTILDGDLAPRANDDAATVGVSDSVLIDVRANDRDDGGVDRLTVTDVSILGDSASGASVEIDESGSVLFTAGATPGVVTLQYTIRDRMLRESTAEVFVEVTAIVPIAVDDVATTPQDTPVTVSVLDNDGPAELDFSTADFRIVAQSEGTVDVANGQITYTPPANAVGEASIVYELCSEPSTCDRATLVVTVTEVEPTGTFQAEGRINIPANAGPQILPWMVVSSGQAAVEPGTTFSIETDAPELFTAPPTISSAGTLSFEPRPSASGVARTTITVTNGGNSRVYRLNIQIS